MFIWRSSLELRNRNRAPVRDSSASPGLEDPARMGREFPGSSRERAGRFFAVDVRFGLTLES
ncbi:hypothetical protein PGTUg99_028210 [Puccinia graminis f. sp. tritici]|uniref:Uncharacterized protein n=1 Tax=Puccinia graminis f. sp. tritici TaxID=56615 RepID=A0A5B0PJK8_PUCGR|nr:hypothetical protein PGTUg99_028210 [Puccinia graminis f. sp. tritici]